MANAPMSPAEVAETLGLVLSGQTPADEVLFASETVALDLGEVEITLRQGGWKWRLIVEEIPDEI